MKNFFYINDKIKNQIVQYFFYIYCRRIYSFVIINKIETIDDVIDEVDNIKYLLDSILDFQIYKFLAK